MSEKELEPAAVLIDLENICHLKASNPVRKIEWLLVRIKARLIERGFQPTIWAVARDKKMSPKRKQKITFAFQALHHEMCWCPYIADSRLELEIAVRLRDGKLPKTVVLITSDGDFAETVENLREEGHTVIVAGTGVSQALKDVASESPHLYRELLGETFQR